MLPESKILKTVRLLDIFKPVISAMKILKNMSEKSIPTSSSLIQRQ